MSIQFTSLAGCKVQALLNKANLINSVAHLFNDSITPTPGTPLATLLAAECSFEGYAPITIAAWSVPFLSPGSGYAINAPLLTWTWVAGAGIPSENVKGYFLVDAGGNLLDVVIFDAVINMAGVDQTVKYTPVEEYIP